MVPQLFFSKNGVRWHLIIHEERNETKPFKLYLFIIHPLTYVLGRGGERGVSFFVFVCFLFCFCFVFVCVLFLWGLVGFFVFSCFLFVFCLFLVGLFFVVGRGLLQLFIFPCFPKPLKTKSQPFDTLRYTQLNRKGIVRCCILSKHNAAYTRSSVGIDDAESR